MDVLHSRCAGLDVHSRQVNACVRVAAGRKVTKWPTTLSVAVRALRISPRSGFAVSTSAERKPTDIASRPSSTATTAAEPTTTVVFEFEPAREPRFSRFMRVTAAVCFNI